MFFKKVKEKIIGKLQENGLIGPSQTSSIKVFNILPDTRETNENGIVKIKNLTQYREELENGCVDLDFSELDVTFEDIQQLDLENLNLDINIRKVFVPYNGSVKYGNNILNSVFNTYTGDYFLKINKSKLAGNNVTGDLRFFEPERKNINPVYVWYSEETFDNKYKTQYPQFFLSKDAPTELREKYYNPQILTEKVIDPAAVFHDLENKYKEITILKRQELSLDEYIKYYEFLNGKYLGNFKINKFDMQKINIIENYGLDRAQIIFNNIDKVIDDISKQEYDSFGLKSFNISDINNESITLSLNLKYKND